ncbi:response regulator transcription factor [Maliponia aquimaris]|nr:LuxR C-terminal-related transcriptional regulator [Maliponia aquimaris]
MADRLSDLSEEILEFRMKGRRFAAIPQEDWVSAPDEAASGALRDQIAGRIVCDGDVFVVFGDARRQPNIDDRSFAHRLTHRELKVACLISEGLTDKEIARKLGISAHTVREHCRRACAKLNISRRSALVRYLFITRASGETPAAED